ncbi:phosphate ABC transporter permease PstA [Methylovirgula sp. 4M-Z18]|uniref:phosphate ABC transporter permease PstA n=1 Tax=Methylovirgula sp. 4M-Z18 TaxID=2293567 RepID=UPI000E2EB6EF|nr:phosphate ABC transporter permease PstA [Methylovirgula sp. 4M-Z18]RFB79331.1 phosphate ABC transporter permease PstA [Methylovirgula sp. 4M-Z18]
MEPAGYAARKRKNRIILGLCLAAMVFGLTFLAAILLMLFWNGFSSLGIATFTQMTPAADTQGGLLNPIVGSIIMTVVGIVVGAPIGLLAGTYMVEYGRYTRLTSVVRFINDILLSAPSIIIGLFVYSFVVVPMGGASGLAGAIALAIIVIPVVIRTTENMLLLVPNQLREAASAMGMPRAHVTRAITYRAARSGIITGLLLALARIAGETAPLLFTAQNNNFWNINVFNGAMPNLPTTITAFVGSPSTNWQHLAWAGALLITLTVLALNIIARTVGAKR